MDTKKIILTAMLVAAFVNVSLFAQETTSINLANKSNALQEVLNKTVDNKKVFGASFCVKHKDELWCGSAGDMDNERQFFIASTTKLFVTAIILHLVTDGKVSLDEKIAQYLDADILQGLHIYKEVDYSNEITIRNLLAHTSGLPDYFEDKGKSGKSLED